LNELRIQAQLIDEAGGEGAMWFQSTRIVATGDF
jgi:hypothetical protein